MKSADFFEKFDRSMQKYLNLPALLIGLIVDILALLAIFTAEAGSIQARIFLGPIAQLTIWTTAVLTYLGILQSLWRRKLLNDPNSTEHSFYAYLKENLYQLGNVYLLIPPAVLLGFFISILVRHPGTVIGLISGSLITGVAVWQYRRDAKEVTRTKEQQDRAELEEWAAVQAVQDLWIKRIDNELGRKGYITQLELSHIYLEKVSACTKALVLYHDLFAIERDIALINESIHHSHKFPYLIVIHVLTSRSLSGTRPWMDNTSRYFELKPLLS